MEEIEINLLKNKFDEFSKNLRIKREIEKGWKNHKEFLKLYPFRENPAKIDDLTPEKVFNPGNEYFFYWIEFGLDSLGGIHKTASQRWRYAKEHLEVLKKLLKIVVDDSKSIAEKIDAEWEDIPHFGGQKIIAKKILASYYPEEIVPIFKEEHLEHISENLHIDFRKASKEKYGKEYEDLSSGEKFQLFNELLLEFKNKIPWLKTIDNATYMRFLEETFKPPKAEYGTTTEEIPKRIIRILLEKFKEGRIEIEQLEKIIKEQEAGTSESYNELILNILKNKFGYLEIPIYENGVIFLFGKLHKELGFPQVITVQERFPDAFVLDKDGNEKKIEFKLVASEFNYDPAECDYLVCWRNDKEPEQPENWPKIISLEEFILKNFL
ncbi:MAG: hypothetical protein QW609_04025 [Candidatus Aenigmatarchaeota archaeon]